MNINAALVREQRRVASDSDPTSSKGVNAR
jgi:hypothetical protein